ncbi:MAG: hypothetical protein K8T91_09285 [Planctomycetes bacterium]|nr:hypothetical protein [Planctomycetota bacterium]
MNPLAFFWPKSRKATSRRNLPRRFTHHLQIEPLEERLALSTTASALLDTFSKAASNYRAAYDHVPAIVASLTQAKEIVKYSTPSVCDHHVPCDCEPNDPLGSLSWEKRDEQGKLLGGATFTIGPVNPLTGSGPPLTVVDNGANDADPDAGQIVVNNVRLGTYTITETVAPTGYELDDDSTRSVKVIAGDLNAVVGSPLGSPPGKDDPGNTDESDFHNSLLPNTGDPGPGTIEWEKRDEKNLLQGGATFTVANSANTFRRTVVDNGANDTDPDAGQIKVIGIPVGTFTVTETVAPAGYAIDDDATRSATVTQAALNEVIGSPLGLPPGIDDPGNTNDSDFHNRLGSIEWEKRDEKNLLQGGATFTVVNTANTFNLTVVDNGTNDTDPDAGQIKVINIPLDTYTVTETVAPAGYALDDDATRSVTVREGNLSAEIGSVLGAPPGIDDPGNTDESDFHNRLGSIEWEKRGENTLLLGGATFTVVSEGGTFNLTVVDNGANDTDPDAGQIKVINIPLATYTVTETVAPIGYALDDDPTRTVIVREGNLSAEIGTALGSAPGTDDPGNGNESDFHNAPLPGTPTRGSLSWEKRDNYGKLLGGATFTVGPTNLTTGSATPLTVVDNGINDADPDVGQITVGNVLFGTYTITETVAPAGYALDKDPTRVQVVSASNLDAVVGVQGVNNSGSSDESDFHNCPLPTPPTPCSDPCRPHAKPDPCWPGTTTLCLGGPRHGDCVVVTSYHGKTRVSFDWPRAFGWSRR